MQMQIGSADPEAHKYFSTITDSQAKAFINLFTLLNLAEHFQNTGRCAAGKNYFLII